jgi:CheY-like chemotaxis protein
LVLLVEDEELVRGLVRRTLHENGYDVIEAPDGLAALESCEGLSRRIDVLISDVVMPRMSGPELAARLTSAHPHIKVVLISGYADKACVRQAGPREEAAYLHKPFGPEALLEKIREVLASPSRAA